FLAVFFFQAEDGIRDLIVTGVQTCGLPISIVEDFKNTLAMQATYKPEIWVSSHAGQFNLHKVYKPGDPYNPSRFGDLAAYRTKKIGRASCRERGKTRVVEGCGVE